MAWGCGDMFARWTSPAAAFEFLKELMDLFDGREAITGLCPAIAAYTNGDAVMERRKSGFIHAVIADIYRHRAGARRAELG